MIYLKTVGTASPPGRKPPTSRPPSQTSWPEEAVTIRRAISNAVLSSFASMISGSPTTWPFFCSKEKIARHTLGIPQGGCV